MLSIGGGFFGASVFAMFGRLALGGTDEEDTNPGAIPAFSLRVCACAAAYRLDDEALDLLADEDPPPKEGKLSLFIPGAREADMLGLKV